jgi:hypothetical protein
MDGKRTNFDMRRRNLDDDYNPDSLSAPPAESPEARPTNDDTRDLYDRSFLAERGLLAPPRSN